MIYAQNNCPDRRKPLIMLHIRSYNIEKYLK